MADESKAYIGIADRALEKNILELSRLTLQLSQSQLRRYLVLGIRYLVSGNGMEKLFTIFYIALYEDI